MVDGEHLAEHLAVVALAITADGTKVPVGLWEGSTENATVVKALLADLVARGLDAGDGLLIVIDGAKALSAAVRAVFGASAAIQRCTVHKRRNVADHLPERERGWVDTKLGRIFANPDPRPGYATRRPSRPPWPASTRVPPRRCARVWRRCSPSPGWASPAWPAR